MRVEQYFDWIGNQVWHMDGRFLHPHGIRNACDNETAVVCSLEIVFLGKGKQKRVGVLERGGGHA